MTRNIRKESFIVLFYCKRYIKDTLDRCDQSFFCRDINDWKGNIRDHKAKYKHSFKVILTAIRRFFLSKQSQYLFSLCYLTFCYIKIFNLIRDRSFTTDKLK